MRCLFPSRRLSVQHGQRKIRASAKGASHHTSDQSLHAHTMLCLISSKVGAIGIRYQRMPIAPDFLKKSEKHV